MFDPTNAGLTRLPGPSPVRERVTIDQLAARIASELGEAVRQTVRDVLDGVLAFIDG